MDGKLQAAAGARRGALKAQAAELGIDEDFVSDLVDAFYARVRGHETLGPIFAAKITGDWAPHLAKMKQFWASVAMSAGVYSGDPAEAHRRLEGVKPANFATWLALFAETLDSLTANPAVKAHFMERADRIAYSLQLMMFPFQDVPPPAGRARPGA